MDEFEKLIMDQFAVEQPAPADPPVEPAPKVEQKTDQKIETSAANAANEPKNGETDGSEGKEKPVNPADPEEVELEWDSFIDAADKSKEQLNVDVDYSKLGEALGFQGVKSQDEIVAKVQELRDLKSKEVETGGLPELLVEAIQLAKSNGDYLAYLGVAGVDYKNVDPVDLFEDEVAELFYDTDGKFKEDEYYDYIDSINEKEKQLRGLSLKKELIRTQEEQKAHIRQLALSRKNEELRAIQTELQQLNDLNGFPLKNDLKKQIFEDFASGKYKEVLGLEGKNGQDFKRSIETYVKAKFFDAIQKYYEHKIKTDEKRKVHRTLSNATNTTPPKLDNPVNTQQVTGVDSYLSDLLNKINN